MKGFHVNREDAVELVMDSMCHMAFDFMWMTAHKCLPLPERVVTTALMCLPLVSEGRESPDGFSRKFWIGHRGQLWYWVTCRCGDLMYRAFLHGDPRLVTRNRPKGKHRVGEYELYYRHPEMPRLTP